MNGFPTTNGRSRLGGLAGGEMQPPFPLIMGARGTGNELPYYEQEGNVVEMLGKDKESILYHF